MCPFSLEQPYTISPSSHLGCHLQKTYQNIPFRLDLSPVDTGVPYCLLMLRKNFNDFTFEHRSSCCATEPGYAWDIGAIEIWLIYWLINSIIQAITTLYCLLKVKRNWKICRKIWTTKVREMERSWITRKPRSCAMRWRGVCIACRG